MNPTKRQKALAGLVDRAKHYTAAEALALVKKGASAKFNESVDVAVNLGITVILTELFFSRENYFTAYMIGLTFGLI